MNTKIKSVSARQVLDSRGNYTIEVAVETAQHRASFAVPAGASTGSHEAKTTDADTAEKNVRGDIQKEIVGMDASDQRKLDERLIELDNTPDKSRLGAQAILGTSIAAAKVAALAAGIELHEYLKTLAPSIKPSRRSPYLFINLINGGAHAKSPLTFQEYMIVPQTETAEESLRIATAVQKKLGARILEAYGPASANCGDEGGYVLTRGEVKEPLQLLRYVVDELGYKDRARFALDTAASGFYREHFYTVDGEKLSPEEYAELLKTLARDFHLFSIEDPLMEEDFHGFAQLRTALPGTHIVGDDLTVTNVARLGTAIKEQSISAIIIKPNQIGTLTETLDVMKVARNAGLECIASHRSGETNDSFIADLAYAFGCFGLKTGAPRRGERLAKYNRLLEIEASSRLAS